MTTYSSILARRTSQTVWKSKTLQHWKISPATAPGQKVSDRLLRKSRGQLLTAPERMKQLGQRRKEAQLWVCLLVKVWCWKQQYCIRTWNVKPMNQDQGKLDQVKQEMARLNINISELKRKGMGEFNSDDHPIYYCGQESFKRSGVSFTVNKRVQNAALGCKLKNDRMILVCFQGKLFNITVIKSMPQPLMLKKLKLTSSMKTYNTF